MKKPDKKLMKTLLAAGAVLGGCMVAMLITRVAISQKEVKTQKEKKEATKGPISVDPNAMAKKEGEAEPIVYLSYAGFPDEITITAEDPSLFLSNPSGNHKDYPFTYLILSDDGEVIYETDLIPAGKGVEWNVAKDLAPGKYEIVIVEQPYQVTEDEQIPVTSTRQEVTITVKGGGGK